MSRMDWHELLESQIKEKKWGKAQESIKNILTQENDLKLMKEANDWVKKGNFKQATSKTDEMSGNETLNDFKRKTQEKICLTMMYRTLFSEIKDFDDKDIEKIKFLLFDKIRYNISECNEYIKYESGNLESSDLFCQNDVLAISMKMQVACAIESVETDMGYGDIATVYCRPAHEYELVNSKIYNAIVRDLTVFYWVWLAFEDIARNLSEEKEKFYWKLKEILQSSKITGVPKKIEEIILKISPHESEDSKFDLSSGKKLIDYIRLARNYMIHEMDSEFSHPSVADDIYHYQYCPDSYATCIYIRSITILTVFSILYCLDSHLEKNGICDNESSSDEEKTLQVRLHEIISSVF